MDINTYIERQKELYELFINFVDNDTEDIDSFLVLINNIDSQNIYSNQEDMRSFLQLISMISENHHRNASFYKNIDQILIFIFIEKDIKQNFTNDEIFDIFKSDKHIILFLLKKEIIFLDEHVKNSIFMMNNSNGTLYRHFFYPELKPHIQTQKVQKIEKEISQFGEDFMNNFEEKRSIGENESYICSLIRQDLVVDFISHVNKLNISLLSRIKSSVFETNPFLSNKNPTLIEYAAFFGSIQIFQFLKVNKVPLESSLWLYAIHGNNPEIIHLLEREEIEVDYEKCLKESIKCHHNEIASYIRDNLIQKKDDVNKNNFNNNILNYAFQYHNFAYFPDNFVDDFVFCYLCEYNYVNLVNLLILKVNYNITFQSSKLPKLIVSPLYLASVNSNFKIVELLLKQSKIYFNSYSFYNNKKIAEISFPSYLKTIKENVFYGCSSLRQLIIPESITSIENSAFEKCISLANIILPSSITKIGNRSFKDCISLTNITIPSSITSIGENAFENCLSLVQVTLPNTVHVISYGMFKRCKSLKSIKILSKLSSIGAYAFSECSSLIEFPYASKQKIISSYAFNKCTSLEKIIVSPHITSIGNHSFFGCKSLTKIDIPDSVEEIRECAFADCSLLEMFKFPFNLKIIEPMAFYNCSSLKEMHLNNIVRIGRNSFANCSRLAKVELPPTLLTVRSLAFYDCVSLNEIKIPSSAHVDEDAFNECTKQIH